MGGARTPPHAQRRFSGRCHRADCRRRGRSRSRAGVSRHHRSPEPPRLGSAVSDRPAARPPHRRRLLGHVSHDAEGVHPARSGADAVALALRRSHVGARRAWAGPVARGGARPAHGAATRDARSRGNRLAGARRARGKRGRVARRDRLRRVLHLFQFLLGHVGGRSRRAVLQARRRTTRARGGAASRRRLLGPRRPAPVCVRRAAAGRDRRRRRRRRRRRLRVGDDVRSAHLVGRCGRHVGARPSRRAGVFGGGRHRRADRRRGVHLVDAAWACADLRTQPARGSARERLSSEPRVPSPEPRAPSPVAWRDRLRLHRCSAHGGDDRRGARSHRRVLRRRHVVARGVSVPDRVQPAAARAPVARRARLVAGDAARSPQRGSSSWPKRPGDQRDCVGDVHPDLSRRLPPRGCRRDRPPFRRRWVFAARRSDVADRPRSCEPRRA